MSGRHPQAEKGRTVWKERGSPITVVGIKDIGKIVAGREINLVLRNYKELERGKAATSEKKPSALTKSRTLRMRQSCV